MNICFSGQANSGKSVSGEYLVKIFGDPWKTMGFADEVKAIFKRTFNVDSNFIEQWKRNPEIPPGFLMPVRKCLQFIGDGFRTIRGSVWIDFVTRNDNIIITDGRYFNEMRANKANDGFNVLLVRPGFENNDPNLSESQIRPLADWFYEKGRQGKVKPDWIKDCPYEEASLVDYFIINDGTLENLYDKLNRFINI